MASALVRGLGRRRVLIQRQWAIHVAQASRSHGQSSAAAAAGLFTQRWAISPTPSYQHKRVFHCTHITQEQERAFASNDDNPHELEDFKAFFDLPLQSPTAHFQQNNTVTIHGFISKRKDLSKKNAFVDLLVPSGPSFQFRSSWEEDDSPNQKLHTLLKSIPTWSPVALTGRIDSFEKGPYRHLLGFPNKRDGYKLTLLGVRPLNSFPKDIIISEGAIFPPKLRHLQVRFDKVLQDRLAVRDALTFSAFSYLNQRRFQYVETPVLFKSTPEGAREFLVPTRRPGYAYALPQSPQQYKQMLMASGILKYYQFARCFRDEDLRADRQPEFTQLDLEMSFASGQNVMAIVEDLVHHIYERLKTKYGIREVDGQPVPTNKLQSPVDLEPYPDIASPKMFPRLTYDEAMSRYGSDKPDLRIPNKIHRIEQTLPPTFISMISDLENPIVEACVFRLQDPSQPTITKTAEDTKSAEPHATASPDSERIAENPEPADLKTIESFIKSIWDNLPKPLSTNPHGQPVPILVDSSKPLSGLSSLGYEAADTIFSSLDFTLADGDILVIQARPNAPFAGGATALGTLRKHIYDEAVARHLLPLDKSFQFLWVTSFPLFTPTEPASSEPGQGGGAGFASTHHPFTAPLTPADFELLATDPLAAKADHYDLVLNGVELGGGSRRIHVAAVQEYVFRRVLKMSDAGIEHFSHLLEALRAGCPPHAGFAFGWDRLCATLSYTGSVRDVIAFPKSKKGEEPVARVPGKVGADEWKVYGLRELGKEAK